MEPSLGVLNHWSQSCKSLQCRAQRVVWLLISRLGCGSGSSCRGPLSLSPSSPLPPAHLPLPGPASFRAASLSCPGLACGVPGADDLERAEAEQSLHWKAGLLPRGVSSPGPSPLSPPLEAADFTSTQGPRPPPPPPRMLALSVRQAGQRRSMGRQHWAAPWTSASCLLLLGRRLGPRRSGRCRGPPTPMAAPAQSWGRAARRPSLLHTLF